ncbi:Chs5p [Kluyveromyces lactis]|uniref:KLLA0D04422p n=1 Tax=Kluyveromyces lactis (strain ATCC 8585 / CBS 2359 / DSM 70799 / NBRC 1267 / NRRL Y-1140 / WM37) TaxID=284590 RepID=Q6CS30_KLULA|nr:uncharacterized protein KLLA0_D04422g [Kluyveromyces lactis]CAH00355.1 KLLA0D04422p [Kluyveromyces lactis]|eukprot:XP_453259.1 uncharacterized protein KLLA0_D04422g [Kluyveromyces lactis]
MVEVSLTVGKVDASLAILTTADHYVIEFPTVLLPESVEAGSVVTITVEQDLEQEIKQKKKFQSVQEQILAKYGTDPPAEPVLHLSNATQTSCVIHWDPIHLGSSQLKSLILYKQGNRHQVITPGSNRDGTTDNNSLKISGLSVDFEYEFKLLLNTTSGKFWSNTLKVHTHKMTDMSGITACVGPNTKLGDNISLDQIKRSLQNIGAKPLQDHVTLETTHFIATEFEDSEGVTSDEELAHARDNNIPIVRPEWIRACELEKRIVGVRDFYLDSDPSNFLNYKFTAAAPSSGDALKETAPEREPEQATSPDGTETTAKEVEVVEPIVPEETQPAPEENAPVVQEETELIVQEETEPAVQEEPESVVPEETEPAVSEVTPPQEAQEASKKVEEEPETLSSHEEPEAATPPTDQPQVLKQEEEEEAPASEAPTVGEEINVEASVEEVPVEVPAEEQPTEIIDNTANETIEETAPTPLEAGETEADLTQPQTEETSPEAVDVTKESQTGANNTNTKKKNKKKKKGKK